MGPRLTIILGVLLLSGWGSGFKTKMCDHDKTVEATKKIYECMLESLMDGLKNGKIPITIDGHAGINHAVYLMTVNKDNYGCISSGWVHSSKCNSSPNSAMV